MGLFDKILPTKVAAAAKETVTIDFVDALSLHVSGKTDQARNAYQQLLEQQPDDQLALFFAAAIEAASGKINEAAASLQFLSQQSAEQGETISHAVYLGLVAMTSEEAHLGEHDIAGIVTGFGDLLKQEGFIYESAVCFEIAIGLCPDNAHMLHKFGDTLHDLHIYDYAESVLLKALEHAPNHWGALYTYAVLLQDLGRFDEAITRYEKAVKLNPDHVKCQNNYGAALMMVNRLDDALAHCTIAAELDPGFPLTRVNLGNIHLLMRNLDAARSSFNEALALDEYLAPAYFGLGAVELAAESDPARVKELFRKAIEIAPMMPNFYHALANLLAGEGDPEALDHFTTAVQLHPEMVGLQRDFGNACLKLGRRDEAIEHLQLALEQNPEDAAARELLAEAEGTGQA